MVVVMVMMVAGTAGSANGMTTIAARTDVLKAFEPAIGQGVVVQFKVELVVVLATGNVFEIFGRAARWFLVGPAEVLCCGRAGTFAH